MSDEKTDARPEDQAGLADKDAQALDPAAQASAELTALVTENSDMRDRLLRTMADMENLRRRTEREIGESKLDGSFVKDSLVEVTRWGVRHRAGQAAEIAKVTQGMLGYEFKHWQRSRRR